MAVRTRTQTFNRIFLSVKSRSQDEIDVLPWIAFPYAATDFSSGNFRHEPIEDRNGRRVFPFENTQRSFSVVHSFTGVSPRAQEFGGKRKKGHVIVCNQDAAFLPYRQ